MGSTTIMLSIGLLAVSFLGGFVFFYMIDTREKKDKKYMLDQLLNVIIQFILYLWAAKIVLQLNIFIHDPISVLAYPSNSMHFLAATIALLIHLVIKHRKSKSAATALFQTGNFVFLVAILLYNYSQTIVKDHAHLDIITIMLTVFVLIYVLLYGSLNKQLLGIIITGAFLVMAGGIAFYKGYFIFFGYMLGPFYFLMLVILWALYSYRTYQKGYTHDS